MSRKTCWLAELPGAGPCNGRLIRAHLIPRQLIKRECGPAIADQAIADKRSWVWACGGITGCSGHHGALDYSRMLRVPRHRIPEGTERLAEELGLVWWLDRTYGMRTVAA